MKVWQVFFGIGVCLAFGGVMLIIFAPTTDTRDECALSPSCDLYKWDNSYEYREYYGPTTSVNTYRPFGIVTIFFGIVIALIAVPAGPVDERQQSGY